MNRDSIDLRLFNAGLVSNPDQQDVPLEAQTEGSYNCDVDVLGRLAGIKKQTLHTSYGADGSNFGWINRSDGKWDLIYTDGTDIKVVYDFYGTPAQATLKSGYEAKTIVSNNQEVHIGCGTTKYPQWIGYISYGQFGGSAPTTLQVMNNSIVAPSDITLSLSSATDTTSTPEDAVFLKGTEYEYAVSYVYDGYQESPLANDTYVYQVTTFLSDIRIKANISNYSTVNKRVSGIKIYRRERPFFDSDLYTDYTAWLDTIIHGMNDYKPSFDRFETGSLGEWGEYKLVADIDINASAATDYITTTGWATSSPSKYVIVKDTNKMGASYYNNVGISESFNKDIASYTLGHGLSASVNNMLFIAQAAYGTLTSQEAAHMIFRSKPYRYDTFDQTNDRLILPTMPKAMRSHRGKLYVWDENNTYIIDPISFQIEKVITGRGCSSQKSIVETDYGLYWANENGAYWSTPTEELIKPIKDNLTESIKAQYQSAADGYTPVLTYNSTRSQLLVHLGSDAYAYYPITNRWDYYQDFQLSEEDAFTGAFIGKDGETYTVTEGGIYKDFASSTRAYWRFITKEFTCDDPSQDKKFYKLITDYSGTLSLEYSLNGGTTYSAITTENIGVLRGKTIKLRIGSATANATLDSLSILYRRLRGKR